MDLGAITNALGGLIGGAQQQASTQGQESGQGGGGFNVNPAVLAALLPVVIQFVNSKGGIQGIIGMFRQAGAESEAKSWVTPGGNAQVSPEQVSAAFGPDVDKIAQQAGVPKEEAATGIAAVLPKVIDIITPDGEVPSTGDLSSIINGVLGKK
jgi:uncharacterized protein YidB (DUF937 family)